MTALTPTQLVPDAAATDLTSVLATPGSTTLTFQNTGQEMLVFTNGATSCTVTLDVGATVLGQPVTAFTAVTIAANASCILMGPFHAAVNSVVAGVNTVTVVLSNVTTVKTALVRHAGVN
jgi:hypothetical protein